MAKIALGDLLVWGVDDGDPEGNYNEGDVGLIAMSIRRFGFNNVPKVWEDNKVRAGNHTVLALRDIQREGEREGVDLAWPPANIEVRKDDWYIEYVDISHLDENRAIAFAIADNRSATRAVQDERKLLRYLNRIRNDEGMEVMTATGYDEEDFYDLVKRIGDELDLDEFKPVNEKEIFYRVVVDGLTREDADNLAATIPMSRVEQYHEIIQEKGRGAKDGIERVHAGEPDPLAGNWDIGVVH